MEPLETRASSLAASPRSESWLAVALRRDVLLRSLRVAALVGTVLVAINHGDHILAGDVAPGDWLKMALTYFVPYCVSTHASVSALRSQFVQSVG